MFSITKSVTARKIASNTIYQIVGKAITMSVTIAITVLITRFLGRSAYGQFSLMQSFPALFFIIADFGFNAVATRVLTQDFSKANKYFANVLAIRLLMSLVLITVSGMALLLFPYSEYLRIGIQVGLLMILTQALFATTNIIFQVKLRYDLSTIGLVAGSLATLVFALIAVNQNWGVFWINFGYVLAGLVTFFVNATFVKRLGVKISLSFDADVWKYLFVQALPLGLMFVFSQINFKADSILLSVLPLPQKFNLSNTDSVALYSLPYKIFEVSLVLPTFFMNSMYPVFVRHMSAGSKKLKQTFYKSMLVLFGGGLIVGLAGYVLAPIIIKLLGGSEFEASVSVLRILLGGVFLFYLTQPISWLIVTLKKQVYLPIVYFISAAFNLLLNTILIPKYSFYASAYLTWVSEILILILLAFFAVKAYKTFYAKA